MRRWCQRGLGLALLMLGASSATADVRVRFLFDLEDGMNQPSAVSVTEAGTVFVLDGLQGRVVKFDPQGRSLGDFTAPEGQALQRPMDLRVYEDSLIVSDTGNHRLVQFRQDGEIQRLLPLPPGADKPAEPTGLALLDGVVYWSDRANSRLCASTLKQGELLHCWGEFGASEGAFRYPFQITIDRDRYLYVADVLNGRIQVFNERGRSFGAIARFGVSDESLLRPNGVVMDGQGTLMVSDAYQGRILTFKGRRYAGLLQDPSGHPLRFDQPVGLARWRDRLYVTEMANNRVRVYQIEENQPLTPPDSSSAFFTEPTRRDCVTCHLSWSEAYPADTAQSGPVLPVGSRKMCMSCHHGAVIDSRHALETGEQHPDYHHSEKSPFIERTTPREERLSKRFPLVEEDQPYCGSCHTPHRYSDDDTGLTHQGENLWMRDSNQESEICLGCHEAHGDAPTSSGKTYRNHPYDIALKTPPQGEHEGYPKDEFLQRGLPKTLSEAGARVSGDEQLICATCHRAHGGAGDALTLLGDEQICTECHRRQASKTPDQAHAKGIHPLHFKPEREIEIDGKPLEWLACESCHDVHGAASETGLLHEKDATASCRVCHDDLFAEGEKAARKRGIHPVAVELDEPVTLRGEQVTRVTCESCHRVHDGEADSAALIVTETAVSELCATCHPNQHAKNQDEARRKGIHPVNIDLEEPVVIDDRELTRLDCLSCHAVHAGQPDTPSLIEDHRDGSLCKHCHEAALAVSGTDHDLRESAPESHNPLQESPTEAGLCGACHSMHRNPSHTPALVMADTLPSDEEFSHLKRDKLCQSCHRKTGIGEERIVTDYTHPHQDLIMKSHDGPMPLFDQKEKPAEIGEIACATCHDPHVWSPYTEAEQQARNPIETSEQDPHEGNVLNSFLRQKRTEEGFCADCHGLETRIKYKYYHDARSRPGRAEYLK